jgi:DNA adenine methylase
MPEHAIINDLNQRLMGFYKHVQTDYDNLRLELAMLEETYAENRLVYEEGKSHDPEAWVEDPKEGLYHSMRDMFNGKETPSYSPAAIYYFMNKTAYPGMIRYNSNGEYNVPYGRYKTLNTKLVSEAHSRLLASATILCDDYQKVFELCEPLDFVFIDPPYDCAFNDYGNVETLDGFTEEDHVRLHKAYLELPCPALMVIGLTDLTYDLYGGMIVHSYEKAYAVNIRNRFKSASRHVLVMNC